MNSSNSNSAGLRKRFLKFLVIVGIGLATAYLTFRHGIRPTPESVRDLILTLGPTGPILYTLVFVIRPLFLIPSVLLFIAGGLAYGPVLGPAYASLGAAGGGALGFWLARSLGRDYVLSKLKLGAKTMKSTRFTFTVVFLLSLLPVMPVTAINYGAGLSRMGFRDYFLAHVLGITPRAFAYGFFGHTLLEIGSPRFRAAVIILILLSVAAYVLNHRLKARQVSKGPDNLTSGE
ncbi:MAG: TVP38/TMEM64 family protein [Nitrospinaceae bacterium]